MIARIFGKVISKSPSSIIVKAGGIGFEVLISGKTFEKIPEINSDIELDVYTHVREDDLRLVGFLNQDEKEFFTKMLGVSGISIKIALSALSIYSSRELKKIISNKEVDLLRRVPGIGKKLAERMILELRDRIKEEGLEGVKLAGISDNKKVNEVKQALKKLGYSSSEIGRAIMKLDAGVIEKEKVENILKMTLKEI